MIRLIFISLFFSFLISCSESTSSSDTSTSDTSSIDNYSNIIDAIDSAENIQLLMGENS